MADDGLFKGFEDKKEGKKKMPDDALEIKIRLKKSWLIHIIYLLVIIILLILVFYNPFSEVVCKKGLDEITSEPVVEEPEVEETTEPVVEEEPELEVEPEPEEELSGDIILTIDSIKLDANKTKVESITVKIDNQDRIFTPLLRVYWYDTSSSEQMKADYNGGEINFTGPIPVGRTTIKKLDDELKNRYLRIDDEKREFFKIELYDLKDKTLLDTKTKSIATD